MTWTLGYRLRPDIFAQATVSGRSVQLTSEVVENPLGELSYEWADDPDNPQPLSLGQVNGPATDVTVPAEAMPGEYYFNLHVSSGDSIVARARTFVTVTPDSVRAFDIDRDHAAWIDDAVLYEIAPWYFGRYWTRRQLRMIADKIPEIAALGVTAIWLQPITQTFRGGQGYDVTDYFKVWDEIGTKDDLRDLVDAAHAHGLKVLLDIVLNHSSLYHPYARDAAEYGAGSYYFGFYQRVSDGAPYSSNYTTVRDGRMSFLTYFWPELVIFNYASAEVERFITEASRYWVEEFDIDGYRFDAVWGVHARDPDFSRSLRRSLKRIKPEVLLLAEAKAPYSAAFPEGFPSVFESFDAAYDWTDSAWCISYWAWARECLYSAYEGGDQNSLFNSGSSLIRSSTLRSALTNRGKGFPSGAKILRFLENNDVPRFRAHHPLDATRMAATLLFSLPGIPMLYYGQESGITDQWPSISPSRTIRSYDSADLWPFY
ncbi:MAG: alpha-amylase family glycosyl hydrolase, partial [Rhodothermales bacterium]|nr:alpha-amylase family glycosyl hydrolase [Rhodothermales bacterium]